MAAIDWNSHEYAQTIRRSLAVTNLSEFSGKPYMTEIFSNICLCKNQKCFIQIGFLRNPYFVDNERWHRWWGGKRGQRRERKREKERERERERDVYKRQIFYSKL